MTVKSLLNVRQICVSLLYLLASFGIMKLEEEEEFQPNFQDPERLEISSACCSTVMCHLLLPFLLPPTLCLYC